MGLSESHKAEIRGPNNIGAYITIRATRRDL